MAHLVREFQYGQPPEAIRSHYPTLILEQVYGAVAFYLGAQGNVETDIARRESPCRHSRLYTKDELAARPRSRQDSI